MAAETAIEIKGLKHRYAGGPFCLDLPRLSVAAGACCAVVGPSGSGKTTLLELIAGIQPVAMGSLHVLGSDLSAGSALAANDAARRRVRLRSVGMAFQELELLEHLTVAENVLLPRLAGGHAAIDASARSEVRGLLASVGLESFARRRPRRLSQGERQRVAVARAVLGSPPLLLADEPTGNLDAAAAVRVVELLLAAARSAGSTLLVVTHDRALAERFDRVLDLAILAGSAQGTAT